MRLLATGGTGFVGSHAVVRFIRAGHRVRLLARTPDKVPKVFAPHGVAPHEVVAGDMTDPVTVGRALEGCEAVLHAAADIGVSAGSSSAGEANVEGVRNVVGGAARAGLDPILYTSSISAYVPSDDDRITLDSPLARPRGAYAVGKVAAEHVIRAWQAEGAPITTCVLGGVYGPDSPHLTDSAGSILSALTSTMVSTSGGCLVVDARDVASVLEAAVEPHRGPRRILAGGRFVTWPEWIEVVSRASGHEVEPFEISAEALTALGRDLDERRARGEEVDMPLTEEAALIMTETRATDDRITAEQFGVTWRPTVETMRDTVGWLVAGGHLDPALAPAVTD